MVNYQLKENSLTQPVQKKLFAFDRERSHYEITVILRLLMIFTIFESKFLLKTGKKTKLRLKRTSPQIKNNADSTTKRAQWSSPFLDYIDLLLKENHFIKQSIVYSLTMHVSLNNTHLKNWRGTNMYIIIMVV